MRKKMNFKKLPINVVCQNLIENELNHEESNICLRYLKHIYNLRSKCCSKAQYAVLICINVIIIFISLKIEIEKFKTLNKNKSAFVYVVNILLNFASVILKLTVCVCIKKFLLLRRQNPVLVSNRKTFLIIIIS